jgi:hypothetical protein
MGDLTQFTSGDGFLGGSDGRRVVVVEPDSGGYPVGFGGADHLRGVGRVEPYRFLDPQMLSGGDDGRAVLAVQEVRLSDAHGVDVRIVHQRPPVGDCSRGPELAGRLRCRPERLL